MLTTSPEITLNMGPHSFGRNTSLVVRLVLAVTLSALLAAAAFAQAKPERQSKAAKPTQTTQAVAPAAAKEPAADAADATKAEEKAFKGMRYRLIGPFRGGRSLTAAGIPGDPMT